MILVIINHLSAMVHLVPSKQDYQAIYKDSEILTTHHKRVDVSKAVRDLGHEDSYSLAEGLRITADWMRRVYDLKTHSPSASRVEV